MNTSTYSGIYGKRITPLAKQLALISLFAALPPSVARAASATANFNVTATVATSCAVTATEMAFGTYDGGSATDATTTSTINVNCSLLTPYTISLNNGSFAAGSTRRMGNGTSRLTYEIYRDPAMTGIFGTVAATLGVSGVGTGVAIPNIIYGKIPKNQNVAPGSYLDQITVTVDY
ncbi:MAG: spore coat U domain-containing protein [Burkholderiales bacterium]|nr:spore coat U domain-containing protein [Burkholderiales bacterium]